MIVLVIGELAGVWSIICVVSMDRDEESDLALLQLRLVFVYYALCACVGGGPLYSEG